MKRPTRRRLATLTLATALPLAGCGLSPAGTIAPYEPSDGVSASLGSVTARNLLIVGSAAAAPGVVSGVLLNAAGAAVTVTLATGQSEPIPVTVPAGGRVLLGPAGSLPATSPAPGVAAAGVVQFPSLPSPAGAFVSLSLSSAEGGTTSVQVPVLPATLEYASITPSQPAPAVTTQPVAPTVAPTPTAAPTGTASAEATGNPT